MRRLLNVIVILFLLLLIGAAYSFWSRDHSLARLRQRNSIRIGYTVEAPFAFRREDGEVTGVSPEVARQIVAQLGVDRIEWIQTDFDDLISDLEANRFDVIAGDIYITQDRAKRVNFSNPTLHVQQGLLVQRGSPKAIHSYHELTQVPDIRIAVISGAVEELLLHRLGVPAQQIIVVPDVNTGRAAVKAGIADGLALTSPAVRWIADQTVDMEMAQPFEQPDPNIMAELGYCAFAFRKQDTQLLNAWNKAMTTYIGTPDHINLIKQFGVTEAELPGTVTTRQVLSQ